MHIFMRNTLRKNNDDNGYQNSENIDRYTTNVFGHFSNFGHLSIFIKLPNRANEV